MLFYRHSYCYRNKYQKLSGYIFLVHIAHPYYQDILKRFMLPSADKLYGDADFIFQQDLAPAHTAKHAKSWFSDHGASVIDWPANMT